MTKEEYLKLTAFLEAREYCDERDERYHEAVEKWLKFVIEHIIEGDKKDWPLAVHWSKKEKNNPYPFGPLNKEGKTALETVSLALATSLEEAGFPQNTAYWWVYRNGWRVVARDDLSRNEAGLASSPRCNRDPKTNAHVAK